MDSLSAKNPTLQAQVRSLGDYRCDSGAGVAEIGAIDVIVMTSFESSPTTWNLVVGI
jgi:hypothetical protein